MSKIQAGVRKIQAGVRKTKRKSVRLLALVMVAILVFSNFGSVVAVAATVHGTAMGEGYLADCTISDYLATGQITANYKSHDCQYNTQTSDLIDSESLTSARYSTCFLESAEWTNKADGEATISIHYEVDFTEIELRSLYVFTTCTGHSFTMELAIEDILELLEYNDYVDVIMIGANNRASGSIYGVDGDAVEADAAAALMFSVRAEDGLSDDDIEEILVTHTNEGLISNESVHVLGCGDKKENDGCSSFTSGEYFDGVGNESADTFGPYVEVLYSDIEFDENGEFTFKESSGATGTTYTSAVDFVLDFAAQRHAGEVFTLYYIAEYIKIIEARGLDFATTVQAIFNSFDAFATASRNTDQIFLTATLDAQLSVLIGVNLGDFNTQFSRYSLSEACQTALEILETYTNESRYIVLIPASGNDSNIYTITYEMVGYINEEQTLALKNALVYTLTVMNPTQSEDDIWAVVDYLIRSVQTSGTAATLTWEMFQEFNSNIYSYGEDLETVGALGVEYSMSNTATVATTITSEFEITSVEDIKVTDFGGFTTSFDYVVTTETDIATGDTNVTIEFFNLTDTGGAGTHITGEGSDWGTSWSIDISIPMKLEDSAEFCTSGDDFKETNASETTASVERVRTITKDNSILGIETTTETVTVASPKLYRSATVIPTNASSDGGNGTVAVSDDVLPDTGDSTDALISIIAPVALGLSVALLGAGVVPRRRGIR